MALDIYVGPLSRYHAGDWKNVGQQMAEAQGIPYQVVRPDGEPVEPDSDEVSMEEVVEAIRQWQESLRDVLVKAEYSGDLWVDSPETDYRTDRPGWHGFYGLTLKYAHLLHPEFPEPTQVVGDDPLSEDPSFQAANSERGLFQVLSLCELWIPGEFEFMFGGQTATGKRIMISSVGLLNSVLAEIAELWDKDLETLPDQPNQPGPDAPLDNQALYGLTVFKHLVKASEELRQPLILDY